MRWALEPAALPALCFRLVRTRGPSDEEKPVRTSGTEVLLCEAVCHDKVSCVFTSYPTSRLLGFGNSSSHGAGSLTGPERSSTMLARARFRVKRPCSLDGNRGRFFLSRDDSLQQLAGGRLAATAFVGATTNWRNSVELARDGILRRKGVYKLYRTKSRHRIARSCDKMNQHTDLLLPSHTFRIGENVTSHPRSRAWVHTAGQPTMTLLLISVAKAMWLGRW